VCRLLATSERTTESRKWRFPVHAWVLSPALGGHGRLVLIAGEGGIGKSRLASEQGLRWTLHDAVTT
jgi:predicted ATP-dependent serine protease